ncbi:MAG: hypothetical protein RIM84_11595 [Alphaproteobacteria bacterium]
MSAYRCCDKMEWSAVADFGHTGGFDFDLGRCAACGRYLMSIAYADVPTVHVLSDDEAERFLALRETGGLNAALRKWAD